MGRSSRFHGLLHALALMWTSDAFLGLALYRARTRLSALGIPVLPHIAHRLSMMTAQVCIGSSVVVHPGVRFGHGQVVIVGDVEIHSGVVIFPSVTIGPLDGSSRGPTIEQGVRIGTGATVLGPVTVHRGARIGANAVVVNDVPAHTTVVGVPARAVGAAASG